MTQRRAFTLIEMLTVIAITGLLVAILIPALSRARASSKSLMCVTRLGQLGRGWQMYSDDNADVVVPGRFFKRSGGMENPGNWYEVGNGLKYRPRWAAMLGPAVGAVPYNRPRTDNDRQNYDHAVYQCPEEPEWIDERNYGYGYNYQFLGNARQANGRFHHYPVQRSRLKALSGTVMAADSLGTAAGFPTRERLSYIDDDDGGDVQEMRANHGWALDPPRLTDASDHGTGDPGSRRTAVDPRHLDRVSVVFCDGHALPMPIRELGYRLHEDGRYVDLDPPPKTPPTNRLFSGTARDDDPPRVR